MAAILSSTAHLSQTEQAEVLAARRTALGIDENHEETRESELFREGTLIPYGYTEIELAIDSPVYLRWALSHTSPYYFHTGTFKTHVGTPLHFAVEKGNTFAADQILKHPQGKPLINLREKRNEHLAVQQRLLAYETKILARRGDPEKAGLTPLEIAVHKVDVAMARLLLSFRADPYLTNHFDLNAYQIGAIVIPPDNPNRPEMLQILSEPVVVKTELT